MQYDYKEVYFHEYCKTCRYQSVDDAKDPCNECLSEPANLNSHKPVGWEENSIDCIRDTFMEDIKHESNN